MPPYIPWPLAMVRISGVCEILGGFGLLVTETRSAAEWGLVALLISVFPANIYMATHPIEAGANSIAPVLRWGAFRCSCYLFGGYSGARGRAQCFVEARRVRFPRSAMVGHSIFATITI